MSSEVSMSPAKHSKPPIPKEAKTDKSCTNGHSEDGASEKLMPIKVTDNADTSSDSAKDKHKTTPKANKTTKKEDSKISHKSEKSDMNERQTSSATANKEKDAVKAEIVSETAPQNDVANDTVDIKIGQMESSELANGEDRSEAKISEESGPDKNSTDISAAKSTENEITTIKDTPNEESAVAAASDDNLNETADEEMPSFTLDDENLSKAKVKVLRLKSSPLVEKAIAADKPKRKKKAKAIPKQVDDVEIQEPVRAAIEPISQRPSFSHISGRRSFRSLPDLPPRRYHYEAPKQIKDDLDNSSSSLNVTVGSELAADSSFSFFGFGKKREYVESVDTQSSKSEVENMTKTPKRAKLDRSGIFSIISTPISLLRSQFSKTSMHCSTPNNNEKSDEDGVENVSVVDAEEMLTQNPKVIEDIQDRLNKDYDDVKCLDDMAEDALEVQTQIVESQPDSRTKGCNVM